MADESVQDTKKPSLLKSFLAGGVGGMCLVFVGHPMDTIKVRLQTMEIIPGQKPQYAGTMDCFRQTTQKEGFRALYRGMAAPLYGVTPMYALCFFGYGVGQKIFCNEDSFKNLDLVSIGLAGATSGLFTTPILAPGERVKCVLQVQQNNASGKQFKGPVEVLKHLYETGGVRSVTRGFGATMARDSLGSLFYFSSYEYLKKNLTPAGAKDPGVAGTLLAGGTAGVLNWIVALPIDTLKSRYQVAPDGKYSGISAVFADIMKTEGPKGLFRGLAPVMLRAFPANAACFLGVETAMKVLTWMGVP